MPVLWGYGATEREGRTRDLARSAPPVRSDQTRCVAQWRGLTMEQGMAAGREFGFGTLSDQRMKSSHNNQP